MRNLLIVSLASLSLLNASLSFAAVPPEIVNLNDVVIDEQDAPILIDSDAEVTGGLGYADGSLTVSLAGATSNDFFALQSDADVNAVGAISVDGSVIYMGNGSGREAFASIDGTENGQNGANLKILFSSLLTNSGFELGTTDGWTVYEQAFPAQADLNGESMNWVRSSDSASGVGTVKVGGNPRLSYNVNVDSSVVYAGDYSLRIYSSGSLSCDTPRTGGQPDGYCSVHGPYVESAPFEAYAGDEISVNWAARNGSDWYEVFGFLVSAGADETFGTGDDSEQILFAQRGDTKEFSESRATVAADGQYRFRFLGGTYDASGGLAVGASLYVDNVRVISGLGVSDNVVTELLQRLTFENTSDDPAASRQLTITASTVNGDTASGTANILITGINDAPEFTSGDGATATVNLAQDEASTLLINDPDNQGPYQYALSGPDADLFQVDPDTGELSFITPPSDLSQQSSFEVTVTVSDGDLQSVQTITLNVSDAPPVVTAPEAVTIAATGLFTEVDLGEATATDISDGTLTALPDQTGPFAPGTYTITWSVTDSNSNTSSDQQTLKVLPLVNFSQDQVIGETGNPEVTVTVHLNGDAADYPVTVPFTVAGTASNPDDHDLAANQIVVAAGRSESIRFNVVDDGSGDDGETIELQMGTPVNAAAGSKTLHIIELTEVNEAPRVSLQAEQAAVSPLRTIYADQGLVTVTAAVDDPNQNDSHSYQWTVSDSQLLDQDNDDAVYAFDPTATEESEVTLQLMVTDDAASPLSAVATIRLVLADTAPVLALTDSDGDGVDDQTEGFGDSDSDGIPDYLDAPSASNVMPEQAGVTDAFLMETNDGLTLRLGDTALQDQHYATGVDDDQVASVQQVKTDRVPNVGGYFDFVVSDLPQVGQAVDIVLAQFAPIPERAVYRKLIDGRWQDFVENGSNSLASAPGRAGYCPPPGDSAYQPGLNEGDWCVQLTITDGGANDADGEANGEVVDPGGVGEVTSNGDVSSDSSGGGSLSLGLLALMGMLLLSRSKHARVYLAVLVAALAPSVQADWLQADRFSVNASWMNVDSDESAGQFNRDLDNAGIDAELSYTDLDRSGWSAELGYQLVENFDLLLGYTDLGETDLIISGDIVDLDELLDDTRGIDAVTGSGVTFAARYALPLAEQWRLVAQAGLFHWESDVVLRQAGERVSYDESDTDLFYGVGLQWDVLPSLGVIADWRRYQLQDVDVDSFNLGLQYRFGH